MALPVVSTKARAWNPGDLDHLGSFGMLEIPGNRMAVDP